MYYLQKYAFSVACLVMYLTACYILNELGVTHYNETWQKVERYKKELMGQHSAEYY